MSDFSYAQKLFGDYEKNRDFGCLKESLEILNSLIEEEGPDNQRATNFKKRIIDVLHSQIKKIGEKYNLKQFIKSPIKPEEVDSVWNWIWSVMSDEDMECCARLIKITTEEE